MSNCLISIKDYGARYVTATRVAFGHTLYTNEDEARNFAVLNTTNMTSGDFTLGIVCKSYPEYRELMDWLEGYVRSTAHPDTPTNPARVVIPARDFDKVGILTGGITFGDSFDSVTYRSALRFQGAEDTIDRIKFADLTARLEAAVDEVVTPLLPFWAANRPSDFVFGWDELGELPDWFGERRVV